MVALGETVTIGSGCKLFVVWCCVQGRSYVAP
jgi:hypothetical protein